VPFIEYDKRLYQLNAGRNLLGSGVEADLHLPELPSGCQVGINVELYGSFAWLSGESGNVTINGHPIIDEEPVPLFDGDQLSVHGTRDTSTLIFIDDSARHIVRGSEPAPMRIFFSEPLVKSPHLPQNGHLITWILLLALAQLMAVLFLS
jgi:hypothetical protein